MIKRVWFASALSALASAGVQADLEPISDAAMSDVTGQAFVSVDRTYHPDESQSTAYTRVNLGMDIDIQTNVDVLELGRYDREGEEPGTSDLLIEQFALGYINNQAYYEDNPEAPRQFKADGTPYAEGEIVPFNIENPFFEFAFDESTNEVVGVRLGFGKSMGYLSGYIQSLTGDVNIMIEDEGAGLSEANSDGNFFDQIIVALAPLLTGDNAIRSKAKLVYGDEERADDPGYAYGELDPIRGEYAGVPNGEEFLVEDVDPFTRTLLQIAGAGSSSQIEVDGSTVKIIAQDCQVLGIDACFPLTNFKSLAVGELGEVNGQRAIVAPQDGMFLSFQTKDLPWLEDVGNTAPTAQDFIQTTSGAFFNIPNGAIELNLNEALQGIDRQRTEYIDRGVGIF